MSKTTASSLSTRVMLAWWKLQNWRENVAIFVAWHLPHEVVRWAIVRAAVHAEPKTYPAEKTVLEVMQSWDRPSTQRSV
jgi:hypothetical protein